MSRKRRNTSSSESDYTPSPLKKSRSSSSEYDDEDEVEYPQAFKEQPRLSDQTGQHNAFPGLGKDTDELFYGPALDGIDYLRMVRSEAKVLPPTFGAKLTISADSAIEEDEYDDEEGEEAGFYDGIYTARTSTVQTSRDMPPAQLKFYNSLLDRFQSLRTALRSSPPLSAVQALDAGRPITLPPNSNIAQVAWEQHILHHEPAPAQVASIDVDSLLELTKMIGERLGRLFQSESASTTWRVGVWIWALLAKFPDRGELGSEEIAELRAFASRVVQVVRNEIGFATEDANLEDQVDEDDDMMALLKEVSAAREKLQGVQSILDAGLKTESATDQQTMKKMIEDVVLTLVGEVYGQRDILDLRETWQPKT